MVLNETSIIQQLEYLKSECERLKGNSYKYLLDTRTNSDFVYVSFCDEIDSIISEYNWLIPSINKKLEDAGFNIEEKEISKIDADLKTMREKDIWPMADKYLMRLSLKCNRILVIMKNVATSNKDVKNKFEDLKKEIEDLEKEISSETLKNLRVALEEFELNHLLATTLICGRITIYSLDSISNEIDEVINEMKKVGLLKPKGSADLILKSNKKIRGLFAHDLNYFPGPSETISIFGDTINIVKKVAEYKFAIGQGKKDMDERKAREILGGKTNAGIPTLYGTPEEKLKQLESYGGKQIEFIKEQLKKEIDDNPQKNN